MTPANKLQISGSDFKQTYDFWQFHFHWGVNDNEGTEHFLDSRKGPLEVLQLKKYFYKA